jgi:hypothetical protein
MNEIVQEAREAISEGRASRDLALRSPEALLAAPDDYESDDGKAPSYYNLKPASVNKLSDDGFKQALRAFIDNLCCDEVNLLCTLPYNTYGVGFSTHRNGYRTLYLPYATFRGTTS